MLKKLIDNKKGITLIVLVVTIIVILILAGVAISTLMGENGLINRTIKAKTQNEIAGIKEQIELAVLASMMGGNLDTQIDEEALENELRNTCKITDITKTSTEGESTTLPWTVKKDGYTYTISTTGKVEEKEGIAITTGEIEILSGSTQGKTVTAELLNGETGTITWSSSGNITLSETTGKTTTVTLNNAVVGDTATVTATWVEGNQTDSINVKVVAQATELTIEPITLGVNETKTIENVTAKPANAEKIEITGYNITTGGDYASVEEATGEVTGRATGIATITVTAKGILSGATITGTCEVTVTKQLITLTAEQIAADPKAYYGKKVENYKASDSVDNIYRIFYVNTEEGEFGDPQYTIYLKADDSKAYDNKTYPLSTSYASTNTKVREMNPEWADKRGSFEKDDSGTVTWKENEQAAAYLCSPVNSSNYSDPTITYPWKSYYKPNDNNVNYVIGGPSIEMYVKSYNQTHDAKKKTDAEGKYVLDENKNVIMLNALGCQYQTNQVPGYGYKVYEELQNSGWYTNNDTLDYSNTYNSMYCGKTDPKTGAASKTGYWWLASPSANGSDDVCRVGGGGALLYINSYNGGSGLCPLVSLKSSFQIQIEQ